MTPTRAAATSALLLAVAAGSVDAIGYIILHQIFTANMTGNTTKLGIAAGRADVNTLIPFVVAVAGFVVAIAIVTASIELATRRGARSTAAPALIGEAALLAALMAGGTHLLHHNTAPDHTGSFYLLLTLAVVAMGVQTASFARALGATIRTTYVSGLITTFAQELVNVLAPSSRGDAPSYLRDELGLGNRRESLTRLLLHVTVWSSFVVGAAWGGYAEPRWSTWPLALAVATVLAVAALDIRLPLHRHPGQDQRRA